MSHADKVYRKSPSVLSKIIDGELVLVPLRKDVGDLEGKIYIIKGIGVRIWELFDGKKPIRDIKDIIFKEFHSRPREADSDMLTFIRQLENKKLIIIK